MLAIGLRQSEGESIVVHSAFQGKLKSAIGSARSVASFHAVLRRLNSDQFVPTAPCADVRYLPNPAHE